MNWVAAILFIIGVVLVGLEITRVPSNTLLLAGIIVVGGGVLFSNLFKEY